MSTVTSKTCPVHLLRLFESAEAEAQKPGHGMKTLEQLEAMYAQGAQQAGIPARYLAAVLKRVDPSAFPPGVGAVIQRTVDLVREYMADGFERGGALVLCGMPGTGKTYCAAAVAGYTHRRYPHLTDRIFWKTSMLRASLMDLNRRGAILNSLTTVPLLVLDDIGMEFAREGDFFETVVDAVIDEREANLRPLILTSNLTPEKLEEKLGPRAWDRLSGGWGTIRTVVGPSARKSPQHPRSAEARAALPAAPPRSALIADGENN